MSNVHISNDLRLTDSVERNLVREMAREHNGANLRVGRGLRRFASALGNVVHEVSNGMGNIGEARYS